MAEHGRIGAIGGKLIIQSVPGSGMVTVSIPLEGVRTGVEASGGCDRSVLTLMSGAPWLNKVAPYA